MWLFVRAEEITQPSIHAHWVELRWKLPRTNDCVFLNLIHQFSDAGEFIGDPDVIQ